jgi:hypothetical protein
MPDFDAISTALAARFAAAQVTPPAGETNIRSSTGDAPNELGPLPFVLIVPVSGDFLTGNGTRTGGHDFLARFYLDQAALADFSRDLPRLRKWLTVLVDQLRTSVQLGGTVTTARLMSWRLGILQYAGLEYSGLELGIRVVTDEGWAAVA